MTDRILPCDYCGQSVRSRFHPDLCGSCGAELPVIVMIYDGREEQIADEVWFRVWYRIGNREFGTITRKDEYGFYRHETGERPPGHAQPPK